MTSRQLSYGPCLTPRRGPDLQPTPDVPPPPLITPFPTDVNSYFHTFRINLLLSIYKSSRFDSGVLLPTVPDFPKVPLLRRLYTRGCAQSCISRVTGVGDDRTLYSKGAWAERSVYVKFRSPDQGITSLKR